MTKWADPADNPAQNARYWRERAWIEVTLGVVVVVGFVAALSYMAWQTHRTVNCITGDLPKTECRDI